MALPKDKAEDKAEGSKPQLFTQFFDHLRAVAGSVRGVTKATVMVNRLRGKTQAELEHELQNIFDSISSKPINAFSPGAWRKIEELITYVSWFDGKDKEVGEALEGIKKFRGEEKRGRLLALLSNRRFIARCAQLVSWTTQEQINTILGDSNDFFAQIRGSRAQQTAFNDFGQFGVYLVRLFFDLFEVLATQQGYDMSSLHASTPQDDSTRLRFYPAPKS